MGGTVLCDVTDSWEGGTAAEFAAALAGRLGLRVVLTCVVEPVPTAAPGSVRGRPRRQNGSERMEAIAGRLENGVETRVALGDHAEALARLAAEEGADLIVVGSRLAGLGGRKLRCPRVRDLEAATPVPVLVAPPSTRTRSDRRLSVGEALAGCEMSS